MVMTVLHSLLSPLPVCPKGRKLFCLVLPLSQRPTRVREEKQHGFHHPQLWGTMSPSSQKLFAFMFWSQRYKSNWHIRFWTYLSSQKIPSWQVSVTLCSELWPWCAPHLLLAPSIVHSWWLYRYNRITCSLVSFPSHTVPVFWWTIFHCLGIPYFAGKYLGSL